MNVPYTASDLREVAKWLDHWERLLCEKDLPGEYKPRADLIKSIEVTRPGDDMEVIGQFVLYDGWLGFLPVEASRSSSSEES